MANEIAIIESNDIQKIYIEAPTSYKENRESMQKCIAYGQKILDDISAGGMTDELDQRAADYIRRANLTLAKLNNKRSPITQIFDKIRSVYTEMERQVDPKKQGTVPFQLQQMRDAYATNKLKAEQERQRKAAMEQEIKNLEENLIANIRTEVHRQFDECVQKLSDRMNNAYQSITLDNYTEMSNRISDTPVFIPQSFFDKMVVSIPHDIRYISEELYAAYVAKEKGLMAVSVTEAATNLENIKQDILDKLPSLKKNLEEIAKASAAEAAEKAKKLQEQREKEEQERLERERKEREEKEKQKAIDQQKASLASAFETAVVNAPSAPKAKVSNKIHLLNPEGILPIISVWWKEEGCKMSVEDLCKTFKKQIAFCEKLADKGEEFIQDESVEYVKEVKAK